MSSYTNSVLSEECLKLSAVCREIESRHVAIEDALSASYQLEHLQAVLISSSSDPAYLSPITIRSTQIAIEAICANVGMPIARLYHNAAMESLDPIKQVALALESSTSFITELWAKIKTSISDLWVKLNDYWENNFSALNNIKSALERTLKQVTVEYKNTNNIVSEIKDGRLFSSFNSRSDITEKTLDEFITTHEHNFSKLDEILKYAKQFNLYAKGISMADFDRDIDPVLVGLCRNFIQRPFRFGTREYPIVGGEFVTLEYELDEEAMDLNVTTDKDHLDVIEEGNRLFLVSNNKLKGLLKKTIDIIHTTTEYKAKQYAAQAEFDALIKAYDKILYNDDTDFNKNHKKALKFIYRINSSIPGIFGLVILANVKLARSISSYSALCLKETA